MSDDVTSDLVEGASARVRQLRPEDIELVAAREPPTRNYVRAAAAQQEAGELVVLVAWNGAVPVGSVEVTREPVPEARNLRVDEDMRGRGVGTMLLRAAEHLALPAGAIRVGVSDDNDGARRLYRRLGYVPIGDVEEYEYTYVDDADQTHVVRERAEYMAKQLPG
ncbi:GNAT family N-acetyltransferase [Curtobacterium sp. VKM Ac-2922]|uniref:GNAT family N-acetyltransferase n=1 Tax=Curtobacterium sp. VKM Ac-2922 TaxID=2929475 RepID=UPI001FB5601D|nr:GNAT family N-acetyltransferase [Curtobacterium sp. VKM Ac-2922]MCJ1715728.1 GNAT family N-acetyltransferase [Curtobacterium sp. VKM Ac-2922]